MYKYLFLLFLVLVTSSSYAQLYQGPANGSVPNGVIVSTDNFSDASDNDMSQMIRKPLRNTIQVQNYPDYMNKINPKGPEGSNVILEKNISGSDNTDASGPFVLRNYQGFLDPGTYIPPDNYMAAGPQHVIAVDNGRFRIWDKSGNVLKTININQWFSTTLSGASAFDPKVQYDHFNKRWIMVWLDQNDPPNQRGYYLISVSDDSIPLGIWYNYALSNTLNGSSESGLWSDYEGVGFDNQALYITGRQFQFGGYFQYCKIRMIDKTQLYANTAGPLSWKDIWDIRDPASMGLAPDGLRPSVIYGTPGESYFVTIPRFTTCTYLIMYKLINPLTSPSMTGFSVPVTTFTPPPNPEQLGGSQPIEGGSFNIRNEPTYRNGFLWVTHSVNSGTGYSNVNYVKINLSNNTAAEDYSFGASGLYHFYPAIAVDQDMNLLMCFSRSGTGEYAGAYYNYRLNSDPPGTFAGTIALQKGKAYYFKDFSSGRNRWGDYNGAWVDPSDQRNIWIITEYAETPSSTWACQIGNLRMVPYQGAKILTSSDSLYFGVIESNHVSDTLSLAIYNYGSDTLSISGIQITGNRFQLASNFSYPIKVGTSDTVFAKLLFTPQSSGNQKDTLKISSNDNTNPQKKVILAGKGYVISPSIAGTIYGVTGQQENGVFLTINSTTGAGTTVGLTGYSQLLGVTVKPSNGEIYAITSGGSGTLILRVNSSLGDAYPVSSIPVSNVKGIAFDLNNDLYFSVTDGRLFKYNLSNNDTDYVGNTGITNLYGLAFNPLNGQLWGVSVSTMGVYKINKQTGSSNLVGNTGFSFTDDITFDVQGKLYAINGVGSQISNLLRIDTSSGAGTLVGSTNKHGVTGIAISPLPIGIQNISSTIPAKFEIYQNYPNPFNPITKIKFDLPKGVFVKVRIYDILGREVETLVNEKLDAGTYNVNWDASDYPSGVYFYRIEAGGEFEKTSKMVLIK
jgi:hypothetical protein